MNIGNCAQNFIDTIIQIRNPSSHSAYSGPNFIFGIEIKIFHIIQFYTFKKLKAAFIDWPTVQPHNRATDNSVFHFKGAHKPIACMAESGSMQDYADPKLRYVRCILRLKMNDFLCRSTNYFVN